MTVSKRASRQRPGPGRSISSSADDLLRLSHDLRTPLTIIAGYLEMLEDERLPAHGRRRLHAQACEAARELADAIDRAIQSQARDQADAEEMSWRCLG